MSSRTVLNSLRIRWFRSSLRSSLKTFSKGWSRENITSHMARAALQTQSALSAGLPRPPRRARASPAAPRLSCSPGPARQERALRAVGAGTCQRVESTSAGS